MSHRPLRVALRSQGCKVNLFDQWEMEDGLRKLQRPVEIVTWAEAADVYVVNTCTVTAAADRQNRQLIYRIKRREPAASVVVTGCQAQVQPDTVAALPGVSEVVSNARKGELPEVVAKLPLREDLEQLGGGRETPLLTATHRARPYLKIQDGCETRCTYCILPMARGASRSMAPEEVLERLRRLADSGASEVVLTGLNMGDYGRDLTPRTTLAELLARIEQSRPVARVRLSSIEPRGVTDALIEVLKGASSICRHLHLPLQAGEDRILKAMHRPYRQGWFRQLVEVLVDSLPGLALGTDVICGFPGEDEAAFEQSLGLCEELPVTYIHAFPYSPRAGTPAATLRDDVSPQEKKRRVALLRRHSDFRRAEFARQRVGETLEVLVEGQKRGESTLYQGLSRQYVPVWFPAEGLSPGSLVQVTATGAEGPAVLGELS